MIYLLGLALIVAICGFVRRVRTKGLFATILDTIAAATLGWLSGLLIGIGARIGMWSIPFFNGAESRITAAGTLQVVLVFSLYGIVLSLVYELFFRRLLGKGALLFGLLITIVSAYPLASAALQQISFAPGIFPATVASLFFVGLMFLPFAIALEQLLARWHRFRGEEIPQLESLQSH